MTIEEYQQYFHFCCDMGKTPQAYEYVKYANIKKLIERVKENINRYDIKYIEFMNEGDNGQNTVNKYLLKKYGDVKLKIK